MLIFCRNTLIYTEGYREMLLSSKRKTAVEFATPLFVKRQLVVVVVAGGWRLVSIIGVFPSIVSLLSNDGIKLAVLP